MRLEASTQSSHNGRAHSYIKNNVNSCFTLQRSYVLILIHNRLKAKNKHKT